MIAWAREHFSVNGWCAELGRSGGLSWLALDSDWVVGQHYAVTFGLVGFCGCITYWPQGKYAPDDELADLMDGAHVVLSVVEYEAMRSELEILRAVRK